MSDSDRDDKRTQNLTIYLIKEEYRTPDSIIKTETGIDKSIIEFEGNQIGLLFVKKSHPKTPRWAQLFEDCIEVEKLGTIKTTSAVLVTEDDNRLFAITFGQGRYLMVTDCWEERFGIRVTLNCIDENKVRSIDKKTFDAISKQSKEQASREVPPSDFGLDVEQDLLRAVTGKPKTGLYGNRMSGMDSLHVAVKADIGDIPQLTSRYYTKYNDHTYKKTFPWVDQIAEVKSKGLLSILDDILVQTIREGNTSRIWLAVPEIIYWEEVAGFKYTLGPRAPEHHDIHLDQFLDSLSKPDQIEVATFKKKHVHCISVEGFLRHKWQIYKCMYGEIIHNGGTYLLSGGNWYRIANDFVQIVNESYKLIPGYDIALPEYNHNSETEYNKIVAEADSTYFALMDRKNIQHGGGYSKIEFCDLYTINKDMIHVKRYGSSSVLSHLFAQGVISAELFQTDRSFREKVNEKLPDEYLIEEISNRPTQGEYRVVFAIISDIEGDMEIPFFSKLNLRNAVRRIEGFGYNVALGKIEVSDEKRKFKKYRKVERP